MTQEQVFRSIYTRLAKEGKIVDDPGKKIIEVENMEFDLPAYYRWVNFEARKLSLSYTKREFRWYLKADRYDLSIVPHAKIWGGLVTADNAINSNYGQYLFAGNPSQFDYIIKTLTKSKESKRAAMSILSKNHILSGDKDLPCTYSLSFRIRDNKLNMSVRMRSNDAIYGVGSDIPCFSFIHEMVYVTLKETYPDLEIGNYHHSSDSFHCYEKHFSMLAEIVSGSSYKEIICPKISCKNEVKFLLKANFENIPETYLFSKWLSDK